MSLGMRAAKARRVRAMSTDSLDASLVRMLTEIGTKPDVMQDVLALDEKAKRRMLESYQSVGPTDDAGSQEAAQWADDVRRDPSELQLQELASALRGRPVRWVEAFVGAGGGAALSDLIGAHEQIQYKQDADLAIIETALACLRALMNLRCGMLAVLSPAPSKVGAAGPVAPRAAAFPRRSSEAPEPLSSRESVASSITDAFLHPGALLHRKSLTGRGAPELPASFGLEDAVVSGWLVKQGQAFPYSWQRRFCCFMAREGALYRDARVEPARSRAACWSGG
jgi:hypothetical protein